MRFVELFQKELISLGFALLLALVLYLFRSRAKLLWGRSHSFTFHIHPEQPPATQAEGQQQLPALQPFLALTASFIVLNEGRSAATNCELTFNYRPFNYQVWPVRPYDVVVSPDDRWTLRFASLAPGEQFQVELLTAHVMPDLLNVRCVECVGKQIPMIPMRVFPSWVIWLRVILSMLGVAAVIYGVLSLGSFLLA